MNANRDNPFNSPPSSTGSHGTVSPTMSSVFSDPDGESTRKLNEEIARVTGGGSRAANRAKFSVNWEAAHRKWPEFYGMPKGGDGANNGTATTADFAGDAAAVKENIPPRKTAAAKFIDDSTEDAWLGSKRSRAEMQPRVDPNDSTASSFSKSPRRAPVLAAPNRTGNQPRNKSPLARNPLPSPDSPPAQAHRRPSLSEMVNTLRKSQTSPALAAPARMAAPKAASARAPSSSKHASLRPLPRALEAVRADLQQPAVASPGHNSTVRSFVMPDISHLGDFVSGQLRFGGAKNGVPVFVKHGRVRSRADILPPNDHAEIDGIEIPEDEENIFVSMDMIRNEIEALQEHDEVVQEYALGLQQEVEHLQSQLKQHKHRRSIDSALGSRSGSESDAPVGEHLVARNAR